MFKFCLIFFFLILALTDCNAEETTKVIVASGGNGKPSMTVIKPDGSECGINLGEVPQAYGESGRIGSLMDSWDQSLIVCGGYSGSGPPFSSFKDCQNFDLVNRSWSEVPDMPLWTAFAGVAPSPRTQKLYTVGGYRPRNLGPGPTEHVYTNTISVMDYNTRLWRDLNARLPLNISNLCSAVSSDNHLYVVGGVMAKLNLETEQWADLPPLSVHSAGCLVTSYKGQESLVVISGSAAWFLNLDKEGADWETFPSPPTFRPERPTLHAMQEKLYAIGGNDASQDVDIFDMKLAEWKVIENSMTIPREHHSATLVDTKYFPECQEN